jgi:hypothetical protein
VFFATYHAKHTGEGGRYHRRIRRPISDNVLTMNADNKVERMVKIWNASWAMRELGWI